MEKFAVIEHWAFGVNYYTASGQCVPDYEIEKSGQNIPTMDRRTAEMIAERGQYRQIKKI